MSRRVWMHVWLMIALAFNGVAGVHASTAMALKVSTAHVFESEPAPEVSKAPPCHQTQAPPPPCHQTQAPPPPMADHGPGCCDGEGCDCDCMQASPALVATVFPRTPGVAQPLSRSPLALSHPEAELPHLIRPPISRLA